MGKTPLRQRILYEMLPFALAGAMWAFSMVLLGWDPEIAVLLFIGCSGMGTIAYVVLQWSVVRMPTRVALPGLVSGMVMTVVPIVAWGAPSGWYYAAVSWLWLIAFAWWARELHMYRIQRINQKVRD